MPILKWKYKSSPNMMDYHVFILLLSWFPISSKTQFVPTILGLTIKFCAKASFFLLLILLDWFRVKNLVSFDTNIPSRLWVKARGLIFPLIPSELAHRATKQLSRPLSSNNSNLIFSPWSPFVTPDSSQSSSSIWPPEDHGQSQPLILRWLRVRPEDGPAPSSHWSAIASWDGYWMMCWYE